MLLQGFGPVTGINAEKQVKPALPRRPTERRSRSTMPVLEHVTRRRGMNPMPIPVQRRSFRHPCRGGSTLGCSVVKRTACEPNEPDPFRHGFQRAALQGWPMGEATALLPAGVHQRSKVATTHISQFLKDTRLECTRGLNG